MRNHADQNRDHSQQPSGNAGSEKHAARAPAAFLDLRPETIQTRSLHEMVRNSPRVRHVHALQAVAVNSPRVAPAVQRRPLRSDEQRLLATERQRLTNLSAAYQQQKTDLTTNLFIVEQNLADKDVIEVSFLREKADDMIPRLDKFFKDTAQVAREAGASDAKLRQFTNLLNGYEFSGGKNEMSNILREVMKRASGKAQANLRDSLLQITPLDEKFFAANLKRSKPPIKVYRGDGRGIDANSLVGLRFDDIEPGGTRDVTFYGMVEHTHTNTAKNGMVSTTSAFDVAHFWATSSQRYGIVYEMLVTDYLHVANLLGGRRFKDRYPGQFEILIPGPVPASNIVSATLYQKDRKIGVLYNR